MTRRREAGEEPRDPHRGTQLNFNSESAWREGLGSNVEAPARPELTGFCGSFTLVTRRAEEGKFE